MHVIAFESRGPARLDGYVTPFGCRLKMNMSKFTILMITRATAIDDEDDGQKKKKRNTNEYENFL